MLIAMVYNKKKVHTFEFVFGAFISFGMVLFAAADFSVYPNFDFVGRFILFENKVFIKKKIHSYLIFNNTKCRYNTGVYQRSCGRLFA